MAEMEDRWLSVDEIGKYLGVSSDTVYRWIDKHAMPAHRMGRLWKFKKDEVDEWVKAGGAAAAALGIPVIIIDRPVLPYDHLVHTYEEVLAFVETIENREDS